MAAGKLNSRLDRIEVVLALDSTAIAAAARCSGAVAGSLLVPLSFSGLPRESEGPDIEKTALFLD